MRKIPYARIAQACAKYWIYWLYDSPIVSFRPIRSVFIHRRVRALGNGPVTARVPRLDRRPWAAPEAIEADSDQAGLHLPDLPAITHTPRASSVSAGEYFFTVTIRHTRAAYARIYQADYPVVFFFSFLFYYYFSSSCCVPLDFFSHSITTSVCRS